MATSFNMVLLVGTLGKDPVSKDVSGKRLVELTVATSKSYQDANGEWQQNTEWHSVRVWDKGTKACDRMHKGSRVFVQGELKTNKWRDRDGRDRYDKTITASMCMCLDRDDTAQRVAQTQLNNTMTRMAAQMLGEGPEDLPM